MNFDWLEKEEDTLIYIGDTMCSWCYGFANNLDAFVAAHPELKVRLVQGGLRPNNVEQITDMADMLKSHWVEINERTNQPFSYDILADPDFIYDTEPASRAVVVVRMIDSSKEFAFFKAVQMAFYRDNKKTDDINTYLDIAKSLGIDTDKFTTLFDSEEAKYNTKADFQLSAEMGVKGFPSTIIKKGKEFFMLSNGFRDLADLETAFASIMSES